ncbi:MAG: biotin--[acetyl-CoA-carboxylase] ligase [Cyanobacteria bacterium P01_D01_bin.105]
MGNSTLKVEKIQAALASSPADLGILPAFCQVRSQFDVHTFETLPSTSTKLWDMLAKGATAGTVVIAQAQTHGRGQRGRKWQSSSGGLYLSLALEPHWPVTHIAQLTCMSAWGIAIAFNNLGIPVKIKWPNDLFFEGKKLGGILTETKLSQTASVSSADQRHANPSPRVRQAVIGVGINWHNLVPKTATTLATILESLPENATKTKINCLEMLSALVLKGILQGYLFQQQVGSQDFMKVYSNLLTQLGDVVSLDSELLSLAMVSQDRLAELRQLQKCSGEVVGISEEGYLKVALRDISANSANDLGKVSSSTLSGSSLEKSLGCITDILLLKPAGLCR